MAFQVTGTLRAQIGKGQRSEDMFACGEIGGVAGKEAGKVKYGQIRKGPAQCVLKIWFGMQISVAMELVHKFK